MDSSEKEKAFLDLVRSIFDFLFSHGFKITSVISQTHDIVWVILEAECLIRIGSDRDSNVYITLAKRGTTVDNWEDWYTLAVVIYFLSKMTYYIGGYSGDLKQKDEQLRRFAKPLRDYLDEIVVLFTNRRFNDIKFELKKLRPVLDQLRYEEYKAYKSKGNSSSKDN